MKEKSLIEKIKDYELEYREFMNIDRFPDYEVETKELSIEKAESLGYDSIATARYSTKEDRHILTVSIEVELSKAVMYHEFTHILDTEVYAKNNPLKYISISGYTEYHASQVALMYMLSAENINSIVSFQMDTKINTWCGEKTVKDYLDSSYQKAVDLFNLEEFPRDFNTLIAAFGALHNYFGVRSICEMYAKDYSEEKGYRVFQKYFSTFYFSQLNGFMHGWLDDEKIEKCGTLYTNIVPPFI